MLSSHARGDAKERLVNTIYRARARAQEMNARKSFFSVGGEERKTERKSLPLSLSCARARDVTINQNDNNNTNNSNSQTKKKNDARRVSMQYLPLVPPSGCSRSRNTPSSPSKYPPCFVFCLKTEDPKGEKI
jgi:hypothetical protein